MGAVSVFTDRNLSLPTSEQILLGWCCSDGVGAVASCFGGVGAIASCLDGIEVADLCLDGVEAVASCLDGARTCCFLLGWCASVLALVSSADAMVAPFDVKYWMDLHSPVWL